MASMGLNRSLAEQADKENDPFVTTTHQPKLRFSGFDSKLFALGPASSPRQAKRALEAHLVETERRMAEAGKLGTALVQQQKELRDRLAEVETQESEGQLSGELRHKLAEIERDYNDVARQTARAFLPKQRVPSNEAAGGSPYVPEGKGGRRSVSPSKFESHATGSPTKLSIPNRKLRNQPANRIHDIEFAAEISTSLITQVRNLQALLAEKDEELRDATNEKSRLEMDAESLQQRLKQLDESEHRYKDENWTLETQMQEQLATQKEAAEREKRLTQAFNVLQADKNKTQRELDDVKVSHAKLTEDHAASLKQHDIELGTAKRNIATTENDRNTLQRKVEDLTNQNQELARAFSSSQRVKMLEREGILNMADDDLESAADNITPDHSPPSSPMKGTTPRHPMLESETLKASLHHAQRTIQGQRGQLYREKSEKLELKRMLQDVRDEVERLRVDGGGSSSRRSRKTSGKDVKKYSGLLLGNSRTTREEIIMDDPELDDPEWEDHLQQSSPTFPRSRSVSPGTPSTIRNETPTDHFETANETSDAAFDTAHERGTETEDFQTGAEEFSDSESEATETESPSRGLRHKRSNIPPTNFRKHPNRESFDSTASTSADEESSGDAETPTSAPPRMRLRVHRGLFRRSRQTSEDPPAMHSSPASIADSSPSGTPRNGGQSLFAELGDFGGGSGDESLEGTPSRGRSRFASPDSLSGKRALRSHPSIQRLAMVDSAVMTDPSKSEAEDMAATPTALPKPEMVDVGTMTEHVEQQQPVSMEPAADPASHAVSAHDARLDRSTGEASSRRMSTLSYSDAGAQHDPDLEESLSMFPLPPSRARELSPARLELTAIETQDVAPVEMPEVQLPPLTLSSIQNEELEPRAEPVVAAPVAALSISGINSEVVDPKVEPIVVTPVPALSISGINSEVLDPKAEPDPVHTALSLSEIRSEALNPRAEPAVLPPQPELTVSRMHTQSLEPDETLSHVLAAALGLSSFAAGAAVARAATMASTGSQGVEPMSGPDVTPPAASLGMSTIHSEAVEPRLERETVPELSMTNINSQNLEPVVAPEIAPDLGMTTINSQSCEPVAEIAPELAIAGISSQGFEPVAEELILPELSLMKIKSEVLEPISEAEPPAPEPLALALSTVRSEDIHPVREVKPQPLLSTSLIRSENVAPVKPLSPVETRPDIAFTSIQSLETCPVSPPRPKRDTFIISRDLESPFGDTPKSKPGFVRGSVLGWDKLRSPTPPIIAEDETRQSPGQSPHPETPESQRPLQDMSTNSNVRSRKPRATMLDSSAQTALTSDVLDQMIRARQSRHVLADERQEPPGNNMGTPGMVVRRRGSEESTGSIIRHRGMSTDFTIDPYRPRSASSSRAPMEEDVPPLPANHKETIEAARTGSSNGGHGSMGPPLWPASVTRHNRPPTPSGLGPESPYNTPTPRPVRAGSAAAMANGRPMGIRGSRQSSITSFASELDNRFNMPTAGVGMVPGGGFGPNTDPRMIQAITQTMIGEFLWKYTRKTGRGEMSENRHRRYFWVHPYTRTLYWSDRDPSRAGQRSEHKAKSIHIEAVRVVVDDNPMPPGLPRKSLVVVSPGRTVKFTCTTNQRHEVWFNALSYLLMRTDDGQSDVESMVDHITREDVDEFNPHIGQRRTQAASARPVPRISLSSYDRSIRTESPAMDMSMEIPTLTATKRVRGEPQRPSGTLTRLSGYWKSSQAFSTLRNKRAVATTDVYESGEMHDSAEDLRAMIERQDREADRLENVRACCDGKHDVGTLTRGKRDRSRLSHAHFGSTTATPVSSTRSRV